MRGAPTVWSLTSTRRIPDRLRDWISIPKANGYESLAHHRHVAHRQVGGGADPFGAHGRDRREGLRRPLALQGSACGQPARSSGLVRFAKSSKAAKTAPLEFVDELKLDLFNEEVYVFHAQRRPHRAWQRAPRHLDFAFRVHSQVGQKCIGAKVNKKLVPIGHVLQSGDQVEILTSRKQKPKEDWLQIVVATASARSKIRASLRADRQKHGGRGQGAALRKRVQEARASTSSKANLEELAHRTAGWTARLSCSCASRTVGVYAG